MPVLSSRLSIAAAAVVLALGASLQTPSDATSQGAGPPSQDIPPSLHGDSLGDGGPAARARLVTPVGLARDSAGNLYIAERGAHRIRRIAARTGIITTFAGTGEAGFSGDGGPASRAKLVQPDELTVDPEGNLVFGDVFNHRVRRIDARSGIITTIAGTGEPGFSGDGGLATRARLNGPFGVAFDSRGNLFITDTENQRIRRVDARTGVITTIAGNGEWDYAGDDGPALQASFARPHRLLVEGDTALLIGDTFNYRIRRLDLRTGIIRRFAGSGERGTDGESGPALDAPFTFHGSLAFAPDGDLVVPSLAAARIMRIDRQSGVITVIAGNGLRGFGGDGGPATQASLHLPLSVVVDPDGSILFTDMWNGRVRRIDGRTGIITTVFGTAPSPRTPAVSWDFYYNRDSLRAVIDQPVRYGVPGSERVRVVRDMEYGASRYARLDAFLPPDLPAGSRRPAVVLVPGRNDSELRLRSSDGFATWGRLLAASGLVTLVLDHSLGTRGHSLALAGAEVDSAIAHVRRQASAFNVDPDRICVVGFSSGAMLLAPLLADPPPWLRCGVAYYPELDTRRADVFFWIKDPPAVRERFALAPVARTTRVPLLLAGGARDAAPVKAMFDELRAELASRNGVTFLEHPAGGSGFERTVDDVATRDIVHRTLCFLQERLASGAQCVTGGTRQEPADSSGDGGHATEAFLDRPMSVALDRDGNLFVSEQRSHRVRRVDARTGIITTIIGTGVAGSSGDGGPAARAQVNYPKVTIDRAGNIYIGEVDGYRIRRIDARTGMVTTIAGIGVQGFSGDGGRATAARITRPFGLAIDGDDNLYFTDTEANRVRRIDARTRVITTVAGDGRYGFGGDGGPATAASLARPHVLTFDPDGNLIIGDSFNQRIRRIDRRTGTITTVAGSGYRGVSGDGGPALGATFVYFGGLAYDTAGNLLVSGVGDHRIRLVERETGIIRPFAGTGRWESNGDGGPALSASFHPPLELVVDSGNNVFVSDPYGGTLRRIDGRTGVVTRVAGSRPPTPRPGDFHVHIDSATLARSFETPLAVAVEGSRVRVVADLDYTGTGDARRRLDVYLPDEASEPLPAVLLVHGGSGTDLLHAPKDQGAWTSRGRYIAAARLAAVTFTHSLNLEGGLEKAAVDLDAALAYLGRRAPSLGIDPARLCVVAYSDGAPLLAELLRKPRPELRCLVAFAPVLDLRTSPAPFWLDSAAELRARFSPAALVDSGVRVPLQLLVGARDSATASGARRVAERARIRGLPVQLLEHPTGGSTFDRGEPGTRTEEMLREWLAFLRVHLRLGRKAAPSDML